MLVLCVARWTRVACVKKLWGSNSSISGIYCKHDYKCNFDSLESHYFCRENELPLYIDKTDLMEIISGTEDLNVSIVKLWMM